MKSIELYIFKGRDLRPRLFTYILHTLSNGVQFKGVPIFVSEIIVWAKIDVSQLPHPIFPYICVGLCTQFYRVGKSGLLPVMPSQGSGTKNEN